MSETGRFTTSSFMSIVAGAGVRVAVSLPASVVLVLTSRGSC
jgi:hypothetical protein